MRFACELPARLLPLFLMMFWLVACTVLPEPESLRLFVLPLQTSESVAGSGPGLSTILRVRSPQAGPVLSTARIAVLPRDNEVTAYRGARWSEPVPSLLRDRVIEAFLENGRLAGVHDDQNRFAADLELHSKLQAFQSEYEAGEPRVRIRLDVRLTDSAGRRVLAARRFEISEPSPDEDIETVVATFGRAADRLSDRLVSWTLDQIARQEAAAGD